MKNIRYEMCRALEKQLALGQDKRAARMKHDGKSPYIHSVVTMKTYIQQARQYGDWLRNKGLNHCTMEEARSHAAEYIRTQKSAWSQSTTRAALAKVFGCPANEICSVDRRTPSAITRGRTQTARAASIDRNHADLAEMCRSVGARHHKELVHLRADDFHTKDGALYAHILGKGGRVRDALVLPGAGRTLIEERIAAQPTGCLFTVPQNANVHGWRADYAARCYRYALDNGHASGELYHCRDGSGRVYDKGALDFVSQNLGHGCGRYYTVVYNYLSYGKL